jgi:hypothetical protein
VKFSGERIGHLKLSGELIRNVDKTAPSSVHVHLLEQENVRSFASQRGSNVAKSYATLDIPAQQFYLSCQGWTPGSRTALPDPLLKIRCPARRLRYQRTSQEQE